MKFNLVILLMFLLTSCNEQAGVSLPTLTPQPTLKSFATATSVPGATNTYTPALLPTTTPSPTPACSATFIPVGFAMDGNNLMGHLTVDGRSKAWLQVIDLQNMVARTLLKNEGIVNVASFSPDLEIVAWALPNFDVQLIHLPEGEVTATLTGHTSMVNALLFSPDGSRLYSASSDTSVIVWDVKKQARENSFQPYFNTYNFPTEVIGLGISPDGKTLVTIPIDGSARTWDTATFKQVGEYPGSISGSYNGAHARYSSDGKILAIGLAAGPGDTTLWQLTTNRKVWSGGMLSSFDFSPDSRLFAHTELDENNRY